MARLLVPPKILFIMHSALFLLDASLSHESHVTHTILSLYRHKRAPFWRRNTHSLSLSLYTTGSIYYPFSDHVLFVRETEDPRGDAEAEPEGTPESETIKGSHETRVQVYYGIVHLAKAFLSLKYLDCLIILCNFSGNTGIREREDVPRETREETHHGHQEDGKERANGRREDHGKGPGQD